MATSTRHQTTYLNTLQQQAYAYDFFQTIRLIQQLLGKDSETVLQIKSHPSLAFPTTDIASIASSLSTPSEKNLSPTAFQSLARHTSVKSTGMDVLVPEDEATGVQQRQAKKSKGHIEVFQTFLGLTGQNGILPDHYTELLLQRLHAKDGTLNDFLNIFNHRISHYFYQAWQTPRFFIPFEQQGHPHSALLSLLKNITGLPQSLQHALPQDFDYRYAGLLAKQNRPAEGLKLILEDYFELPIQLYQYTHQLAAMNDNRLGTGQLLGQRIPYRQNHFTISIGPVSYDQYCRLLPNSTMLSTLQQIVRLYVGAEYRFIIQLKLIQIKPQRLSTPHPQLGWTSWLGHLQKQFTSLPIEFGQLRLWQH